MSAAPVEAFEVEDLDAAGVLEAAAQAEQAERRAALMKLRLAYQWAILNPATPETGVATPGGPALDVLTTRRVPRRPRHAGGGRVHPRNLRVEARHLPGRRGPADRRRPRPTPPPPAALETRHHGCRCRPGRPAASPDKPTPCPLVGARWVDQRLAARTDGSLGPVITDRLVALAIAKYDPEEQDKREDRRPGQLRRQDQPPRPHVLRRHLRPDRHRRHPDPPRPSTTCSAPSPTNSGSTATPTPSASARSKPSP